MARLSPKEDKFYDLFSETATIIFEASEMLTKLIIDPSDIETKTMEIERMEHKGDKQVHDILEELNKSFITPLDREDIYMIAKQLDDIMDYMEAAAHRFVMFNIKESTNQAKLLGQMIQDSCKEVINLMAELKNKKKGNKLSEKIIEINRIEDEGDRIFRQAIKELFNGETPALEVMKWREIYDYLEKTLDACEDVANTVEGVVMKHA